MTKEEKKILSLFPPEFIKKKCEEQDLKEKLLFLALCPESDRKMIADESLMSAKDLYRISYLLQSLGLENYASSFLLQSITLLEELGKKLEMNADNITLEEIEKDTKVHIQWLKDFVNQLPSASLKPYVKRIFQI